MKGIIYYTDNELSPKLEKIVQKTILDSGLPIVSASLKPIDFGKNIHIDRKRGSETYFIQILSALKESESDVIFFCFLGNTCVETINGVKRIDEIRVGELVKTHLGRFRPVTHVFKTPYKKGKPIFEIGTKNSIVKCTPEHPFYVIRNNEKKWIKAEDLSVEDLLLYPCEKKEDMLHVEIKLKSSSYGGKFGSTDRVINKVQVDEDFARFMGLYLSEGHYNGKNGIGFTFNNEETEYQELIKKVCLTKFGRKARQRTTWATQILINIHELGPKFRDWFGENARKKRIPNFVFEWNLKNRLSFIKGVLEGDGSKSKDRSYCTGIRTASKEMIKDLIRLMNESGIGLDNDVKSKMDVKGHWIYRINITKKQYQKMLDLLDSCEVDNEYLGVKVVSKLEKIMNLSNTTRINGIDTGNYVYNLEVEEDNSYIAQSSIVHNCEHDVLYHPSHFKFTPEDNSFYYNRNWYKVRKDGTVVTWEADQVSGLCVYRDVAIEFYKKRLENFGNFDRKYEPMSGKGSKNWYSDYPNIDVRHDKNLTKSKWSLDDFRDKSTSKGFRKIDISEIPGWNLNIADIYE